MRARQRGYSIVEIGIVLVAIGFLVTGALWSFTKTYREEQLADTAKYMQAVHEAVISYAVANRTPGVDVIYTSTANTVTVHMPSGRPILPCPDLDGDGYEDRNTQVINSPITIAIGEDTGRNPVVDLDQTPSRCLDDKGLIPWRTLRTQPADYWGNIYSYWVDGNFSHGVFGFDQTTRGSRIFKHAVVPSPPGGTGNSFTPSFMYLPHTDRNHAVDGSFSRRAATNQFPSRIARFSQGLVVARHPTAVAITVHTSLAGESFTDANRAGLLQSSEQRRINRPDGQLVNVYEYRALQLPTSLTLDIDQPEIANGIAFAVVSHGPNSFGSATHEPGTSSYTAFNCPSFDFDTAGIIRGYEEMRNARRTFNCATSEVLPSTCTQNSSQLNAACAADDAPNGVFFVRKRTFGTSATEFDYDDIVTWMHPSLLFARLQESQTLPTLVPPVALLNLTSVTYP